MIDCPCGYGKNISEEQKNCHICGTDLTPLHRLKALPKLYLDEGIKLFEDSQLDMAIEKLMTAASLNSNSADAHLVLSKVYSQKGLYDEALFYIEKALAISPDNEDAKTCKKKIQTLKKLQVKKEMLKKRLTFAGCGVTFIAGILALVFLQSIINQKEIKSQENKITYTIQKGDSLSKIARERYGSAIFWKKIYETNKDRIKDPDKLSVGKEIVLKEITIQPK